MKREALRRGSSIQAKTLEFILPLMKAFGRLQQATAVIAQKGLKNPDEAGAASTDYLRLFALVAMGYMWAQMVKVARTKKADANGNAAFYDNKVKTARFFFQRMLPESGSLFSQVMAGGSSLMDLDIEAF